MANYIDYWGIQITPTEEMMFSKWKSDRNNCPSFNTISHQERIEYLKKFINKIRNGN